MWTLVVFTMAAWSVDAKGIKLHLTGRSYCSVFGHYTIILNMYAYTEISFLGFFCSTNMKKKLTNNSLSPKLQMILGNQMTKNSMDASLRLNDCFSVLIKFFSIKAPY